MAITDTDLKECGALIAVTPSIWLLICRFHLRQSRKNHRNKLLKGKGVLKMDLKYHMKQLEDSLVKTQTIEEARKLLASERDLLTQLGSRKPIRKALEHVDYLRDYWTTDNLWKSWSDYGRKVAASLLGCEMEGVIPMTNHLESFNGVLKRKHLRQWKNRGQRIRVDILIQVLITHILPSIFQEWRLYQEQEQHIATQFPSYLVVQTSSEIGPWASKYRKSCTSNLMRYAINVRRHSWRPAKLVCPSFTKPPTLLSSPAFRPRPWILSLHPSSIPSVSASTVSRHVSAPTSRNTVARASTFAGRFSFWTVYAEMLARCLQQQY
jgi:hypothetical protein